jgi:hypothetical protein
MFRLFALFATFDREHLLALVIQVKNRENKSLLHLGRGVRDIFRGFRKLFCSQLSHRTTTSSPEITLRLPGSARDSLYLATGVFLPRRVRPGRGVLRATEKVEGELLERMVCNDHEHDEKTL